MAFNFSAKTTAPPAFGTGNVLFGTAAPPNPATQFGSMTTPGTQQGTTGFGTSLSATPGTTSFGGFGAAPSSAPNTGLSFGTPAATTAVSTGFGFGAPTASVAPNLSFGATSTTTPAGGLTFGAPATSTPAGGLSFGAPATSTPAGGLSFGAPATSAPAGGLAFGAPATSTPAGGLAFGAPATSTPAGGLTFGAPATSTPAGGLTFGAPASTANSGIAFGASTSAPGTGLSFGAAATSTAQPGLFGAVSAAPASTAGLSFGATSSAAPTLGSFAATAAATTSAGFGFGGLSTTTTSAGTGLSFGLGGTSSAPATTGLGLTTPAISSAVVGLGGIATTQTKTTVAAHKEIPPKEQPLPNEINQTVEQFKELVKQQKVYSSDITRCSVRDFRKVEQEIDLLNNLLNEVECQLQKNRNLAEKLKYESAKGLQHIEMAQRTQDTPPGLQYENTAPLKYFLDLADHFEREMHALKIQIESADKYVKNHKNPDSLTPQDLTLGMRRLHDTFVALAGRLQSVHSQVESQKETYTNLRKHIYNDQSNPFEKVVQPLDFINAALQSTVFYSPPKVASGPTPFSNLALGNSSMAVQAAQQQNQAPPAYPGTGSNTTPTGFGMGPTPGFGQQNTPQQNTLFSTTNYGQNSFQFHTANNFQLQKPPTGNKRGKI